MIKIYSTKEKEREIISLLAEFQVSAFTNYPIKGRTRKMRGTRRGAGLYKIINYPI